jgi:hypothetical protein
MTMDITRNELLHHILLLLVQTSFLDEQHLRCAGAVLALALAIVAGVALLHCAQLTVTPVSPDVTH